MEQNENNKEEKKAAEETESTETAEASADQPKQEEKQEEKKEEIDWKAKYFYVAAEMENYRKRMDREKENLVKYGNEKVLTDLLQVTDNFERTINMLRGDEDSKVKNLVVGLDMINKQFLDTLGKHGLAPIKSVGEQFDPNIHEAMAQEYKEGAKPHEVIQEFQKGYTLNGRVIRAAKVIVASDKQ